MNWYPSDLADLPHTAVKVDLLLSLHPVFDKPPNDSTPEVMGQRQPKSVLVSFIVLHVEFCEFECV